MVCAKSLNISCRANANRIAENRLQRVTVGGATKADFDYDADGVRVRSLANGETTIYAAGGYEVVVAGATALTRTQYYEFGGQRAAMRVWRPGTTATVTTWLHGDALGSARAATTLSGAVAAGSLTRYTPYGQTASGGGGPSDHTFTGQRSFVDAVGLMDYGARFYDPALGRFVSADSIVPEPGNPQALNRYAYVLGNPLRYVDPTGHVPQSQIGWPPDNDDDDDDDFAPPSLCPPLCSSGSMVESDQNPLTVNKAPAVVNNGPIMTLSSIGNGLGKLKEKTKAFGRNVASGLATLCATVGLCDPEKGRKAAEKASEVARIATGEFDRTYQTAGGAVRLFAEATVEGKTLTLRNLLIYPENATRLNVGVSEMFKLSQSAQQELIANGFARLHIIADRLTGANPGPRDFWIDVATWKLTKP